MSSWLGLKQLPCRLNSVFVSNNEKNGIYIVTFKGTVFKYLYEMDKWNEQNTANQLPNEFNVPIKAVGLNSKMGKLFILHRNGPIDILTMNHNDEKPVWKSGTL